MHALGDNALNSYTASQYSGSKGVLLTLKGLALMRTKKKKAQELLAKGSQHLNAAAALKAYGDQNVDVAKRVSGENEDSDGMGGGGKLELDPNVMNSENAQGIYGSFDSVYPKVGHDKMISEISEHKGDPSKMEKTLDLKDGKISKAIAEGMSNITAADAAGLANGDPNAAGLDPETAEMLAALKKEAEGALGAKDGDADGAGAADALGGAGGGAGGEGGVGGEGQGVLGSLASSLFGGALSGLGGGERTPGSVGGGFGGKGSLQWQNSAEFGSIDVTLFQRVHRKYREKEKHFVRLTKKAG
jgi:hypothetical protein